jgi:hypothetical protein
MLINDFIENDQILPLLFGRFLNEDIPYVIFSKIIKLHFPKIIDLENKNMGVNFEEWIKVSLLTLSMKKPISFAMWGLLCLFISVVNLDLELVFPEIGLDLKISIDENKLNEKFGYSFLLYGLCFYSYLFDKKYNELCVIMADILSTFSNQNKFAELLYGFLTKKFKFEN